MGFHIDGAGPRREILLTSDKSIDNSIEYE